MPFFFPAGSRYLSATPRSMPSLLPFPRSYQPAAGPVATLPVTRYGIRSLTPFPFVAHKEPHFPALRIDTDAGLPRWGIGGLLPASDFTDGLVRPHEATLLPRLQRQRELVLADRGALGKPVLLTLPSLAPLRDSLPLPAGTPIVYDTPDFRYRLYPGYGSTSPLRLDGLGPLVIADGHHRAYTHAALAAEGVPDFAYLPVVLIGGEDLSIHAFMRSIRTTQQPATLLARLRDVFHVQSIPAPRPVRQAGTWLYSYRGRHYHLTRRDATVTDTDPAWLNDTVLPSLFGITDVRTDARISFLIPPPIVEGVYQLPEGLHEQVLLLGKPITKQRFFAEVEAGRLLPPKSTYFRPRLPSGLLVWIPG